MQVTIKRASFLLLGMVLGTATYFGGWMIYFYFNPPKECFTPVYSSDPLMKAYQFGTDRNASDQTICAED